MIIIGEKINGAIPRVGEAIAARDSAFIADLAQVQAEAGSDYLDICAGTAANEEQDALVWLIDVVQQAVETPLCLDSPNPHIIKELLPFVSRPGIVNSVSGEGDKPELVFPLLKENPEWKLVVLTCDDDGIPEKAEDKLAIGSHLIDEAATYGIAQDRLFIDPLVLSVSAVGDAMLQFMRAIQMLHERHSGVHFTSGLSNISYGMPARALINRSFLSLALSVGMDSAIMDPLNTPLVETLYATEVLLDQDRLCRRYNKAFRVGRIGAKK